MKTAPEVGAEPEPRKQSLDRSFNSRRGAQWGHRKQNARRRMGPPSGEENEIRSGGGFCGRGRGCRMRGRQVSVKGRYPKPILRTPFPEPLERIPRPPEASPPARTWRPYERLLRATRSALQAPDDIGELRERHADELVQATEGAHVEVATVLRYQPTNGMRRQFHQLGEHELACMHRRLPANPRSLPQLPLVVQIVYIPGSHGCLVSFRLSGPYLMKSVGRFCYSS